VQNKLNNGGSEVGNFGRRRNSPIASHLQTSLESWRTGSRIGRGMVKLIEGVLVSSEMIFLEASIPLRSYIVLRTAK
jgi:hypothetical protein